MAYDYIYWRTLLKAEHESVWAVFSDIKGSCFARGLEEFAMGGGVSGEVAGTYYLSGLTDYERQIEHIEEREGCRFECDELLSVTLSYEELYYYLDFAAKWHIKNFSDAPEYVKRLNNALAAYRQRFFNSESPEAILARVALPDESEKQKLYELGKNDTRGILIIGRPSFAQVAEWFEKQPSFKESFFNFFPE